MKWPGLYQCVSHSVTPVVPECWLPLRAAFFPHRCCSASGKLSFALLHLLPPPSAPSLAFISTLQAAPFQSIISSTSKSGSPRKARKRGSMLKGVEFFYRSWHPWRSVTRHFALSFTHFFPLALLLIASFFWKAPLVFPSEPVFFRLVFQMSVLVRICEYGYSQYEKWYLYKDTWDRS